MSRHTQTVEIRKVSMTNSIGSHVISMIARNCTEEFTTPYATIPYRSRHVTISPSLHDSRVHDRGQLL